MTTFVGNISKSAETKTVSVGGVPTLVTEFNIAENYQARNGDRRTQFYKVSLWREPGAKMGKYLVKGRPVQMEGRVKGHGYLTQAIVDQILAGADWRKLSIPCQLEISNPRVTFITANPAEEEEAVIEGEEEIPFVEE